MTKSIHLREAFKLALSLALFYWLALWMNWDMPKYGALAIVLISLGTTGASLHKGAMRLVGTTAGLAVGLFGLALFAQDRWLNLLYLAAYLVVIGYYMPVSRYGYAWFVAGFLPPLVWATTYGKVDNAFHYAIFRYLETSAGIIIYTLVSALLWPRNAGDELDRQGQDLWSGLRELFGLYRRQLDDGTLPPEASRLRPRLAGATSKMLTTLQAAGADTPSVIAHKRAWKVLRVNTRALGDALELWRESIDDCRRLELDRLLPRLGRALETVDRRLARIGDLWRARSAGLDAPDTSDGDGALLKPLAPRPDRAGAAALPHFDRAALLAFVQQLEVLDLTSRELLRTMRVLAELEPERDLDARSLPPDLYRPSRWDPLRLTNAVFPALCFAAACVFWIYFDPPTGPNVPNMAVTFALMVLLTPMKALALAPLLMVAMWVTVAPVYFFVMPQLDGGLGLLALIFAYTFIVSLLGGRSPALKAATLPLFVMMTDINNDQVYSFTGLMDGALMIVLGLGIVAVVQMLLSPLRPEQILLSSTCRFFRGCARITGAFGPRPHGDPARGRALRKRYYESMVLPVPRRLQAVEKELDYRLFPDNGREKVQRLLDALQSIAFRLQALELAHARVARRAIEWTEPLVLVARQLRERVQRVFESWSRLECADALDERATLQSLDRGLQEYLDASAQRAHPDRRDDDALMDLYAMLGCARGLVKAVAETEAAVTRIDWDQWAEARF